jgi:hypothetical protein
VQSGGFACSATDDPPCPSGFYCVGGLCVDHPGGGGGGGGGGAGQDLSVPGVVDMSLPGGGDLASSAGDMAKGPADMACFPFPHGCNSDPTCCSQCCAGGCTVFGYCAAQ